MPNPRQTLGIKECTPLLRVPGFDIIYGLPAESFHLVNEGLCKQMLSRLFLNKTGQEIVRIMQKFGSLWRNTKVFTESSRRTGYLMLAQLKGAEFGLLALVHLPSLAQDLLADKVGDTWWV